MNFALPSGSSPPLKPPGSMIICDCFILLSIASTDSLIASIFRFLITSVSTCAPARSNTLAVSYSQFVPGNTGISTLGFAALIAGESFASLLYVNFFGLKLGSLT